MNRLLVLEEVLADDIGLDLHIRTNLRPAIYQSRYANRPVAIIGDPAGGNRSSLYETNEYGLLSSYGFIAEKAPSNDIERRLLAVEHFMLNLKDGDPHFLVDASRCPMTVRGLDGGYKYKRMKSGARAATPDKTSNPNFSHIMDALQYAALCCASDQYKHLVGRILYRGQRNEGRRQRQFCSAAWT